MSSIYQNLDALEMVKTDIKNSLIEKGVDMNNTPFVDYAEKIDGLTTSGGDYQEGYNNGFDAGFQDGFSDGYSDGITDGTEQGKEEQKLLLQPISITENGTYQTENGYSEVNVNVPSGGIDKVRVADGLKFAYSTFEEIPSYFDFDGVNSFAYMFYNSSMKICPDLSMANIGGLTYTFAKCGSLHTIPLLDCSNIESTYKFLESCSSLVNVGGFLNLKASFDLPTARNLTNESFLNIVNTIYDYTANNETPPQYGYATIYMSSYMENKFNNYINSITQKGWTIIISESL